MAYTLQDVLNICYNIIAQPQDSTAYPVAFMTSLINKAQNDICYGNVVNLSTQERLDKQGLTFLETNTFFAPKPYSTVTTTPAA